MSLNIVFMSSHWGSEEVESTNPFTGEVQKTAYRMICRARSCAALRKSWASFYLVDIARGRGIGIKWSAISGMAGA
jgi:hypothetical protein